MIQVYHTNHKTTETAYNGLACKSGADTNRAGVPGGTHQPEKTVVQVERRGRAGIVNRGGGGVLPLMFTPTGEPLRRVLSIHCGGAGPCWFPPIAPEHSFPAWWLVVMVHSTPRPGSRERKKDTDTQKHIVVTPGNPVSWFCLFSLWQHSDEQKSGFWWVLSGYGSRFPGSTVCPVGGKTSTVSTVPRC